MLDLQKLSEKKIQLSTFGMHDTPLEDLAISTMYLLIETLNSGPNFANLRTEIRNELEKYCRQANCVIVDDIWEALCEL